MRLQIRPRNAARIHPKLRPRRAKAAANDRIPRRPARARCGSWRAPRQTHRSADAAAATRGPRFEGIFEGWTRSGSSEAMLAKPRLHRQRKLCLPSGGCKPPESLQGARMLSEFPFALIPAAGRSRRMGAPKLLLNFGGQTVLARLLAALETAGVGSRFVVVHPEDTEIR